jgi:hypothetical protein
LYKLFIRQCVRRQQLQPLDPEAAMTSQDHNHDFGPVGVMVSFGLVVLLVASWVVGLLAAGAFLLALLGAATMVLTLSHMTPQNASRYLWTWSLTIPLPCLFFAESLRHTPSLVTLATALGVSWFYFLLSSTLLVRFMRART